MPNIKQFDSPIDQLHPDQWGAEALARLAAKKGQAGQEIGHTYERVVDQAGHIASTFTKEMEDAQFQHEVQVGAASFAKLQNEQVQDWNATASTADLNDPTIAEKYREKKLQPALDKWTEGFQTKRGQMWAAERAASFTNHMFEKTSADMMTRAGDAAVVNHTQTVTNLSQAARGDDHFFDQAIESHHALVNTMATAGNLSADLSAKLRTQATQSGDQEIAHATIAGMIDRNPKAAAALLNSPEGAKKFGDYLTGDQMATAIRAANAASRLEDDQKRAQENHVKQQQKDMFHEASASVAASTIQQDGTVRLPTDYFSNIKKMAEMPQADGASIKAAIEFGHTVQREQAQGVPAVTDPMTYNQIRSALFSSDGLKTKDILQARADGKLSDKDFSFFNKAAEEMQKDPTKAGAMKRFQEKLNSLKSSITKSTVDGQFPAEDQLWGYFQQAAHERFEQSYAAGNWKDLVNGGELNQLSGSFMIGTDQANKLLRDYAKTGTKPVENPLKPTRKAGESIDDFDARSGG